MNERLRRSDDLSGRRFVVTGASAGLGLALSGLLAARGADVVMGCRDVAKGERVRALLLAELRSGLSSDLRAEPSPGSLQVLRVDVTDPGSVADFAAQLGPEPIDVLVNNAGICALRDQRLPDGTDLQFATNVRGPFLVTRALLPRITGRVVCVGSFFGARVAVAPARPWVPATYWQQPVAYATSKVAVTAVGLELARRLAAARSPVRSVVVQPGWVRTDITPRTSQLHSRVFSVGSRMPFVTESRVGAGYLEFAATDPALPNGSYVGPSGWAQLVGPPGVVRAPRAARDPIVGAALWRTLEAECGPLGAIRAQRGPESARQRVIGPDR